MDNISKFWSDNGIREAQVYKTCGEDEHYILETRYRGMLRDIKIFYYVELAEDAAENWVQNK